MPQSHVTDAVLRAVRELPGFPELRVLDLSCGQGEILSRLRQDGCSVRGTHFREGDWILAGFELLIEPECIDSGVDLTRGLPYETASFDVVLTTEVVEHLPDFAPILFEVGRVLRPGGHLVLSSPNVQRLHSRWWFLLSGTHKVIGPRPGWSVVRERLYEFHINPVRFPYLHALLFQANLRIRKLATSRAKKRHLFWALLWPVFALSTRFELIHSRSEGVEAEGERDLCRWMMSPAMLFSEQIVLIAERLPES